MNNSETPTGANGRKELKVNRSDEADKLLDKYFEDLEKEGYGKIQIRALAFDVLEESIKTLGGDENEEQQGFSDVINVSSSGQHTIEPEAIANGARASARLADLGKVKATTAKLKAQKQAKKEAERKASAGGTEKPSSRDGR